MTRALGWLLPLLLLAPATAQVADYPTGYGGSDAQRAFVLRRYLARGELDQAQALLARLHARGRKAGDFRTALERAVGRVPATPEVLAQLDALAEAYPQDPLPRVVRGVLWIHYAWEARGSGWANQVSKEGWLGFGERIAAAGRDLDLALKADPTLAYAHATKIIVARAQGKPESTIRARLAQALEHDPGCYEAYRSALEYLKPRWHGSLEALAGFAEAAVAEHPDQPELNMLIVEAILDGLPHREAQRKPILAQHAPTRAALRDALDAVLAGFPLAGEALIYRLELAEVEGEDPLPYLEALAMSGAENFQLMLGKRLLKGTAAEARRGRGWIEVAASSGYAQAATSMVAFYRSGAQGYPTHPRAAFEWAGHAAKYGSRDAQRELGMCYLKGLGTEVDEARARAWLGLAARRGDPRAQNSYAIALVLGQGGPVDQQQALTWFLEAAKGGSTAAMCAVAQALEYGAVGPGPDAFEVPVDVARALALYRRALSAGYGKAQVGIDRILREHPELRGR